MSMKTWRTADIAVVKNFAERMATESVINAKLPFWAEYMCDVTRGTTVRVPRCLMHVELAGYM